MGYRVPARLAGVSYEIRGRLHEEATRLEAAGHRVLKLNLGNPGAFGFTAPDTIIAEVTDRLVEAQAYTPSKGLREAREAVVGYARHKGIPVEDRESVYLANGVSDLILMTMQAMLDDGDEVLVPAPDYPLWTAAVCLAGGRSVHYRCDESAGWLPDVDDVRARISQRTKALVIINPNNPTGALYPTETLLELLELARRHDLVVLSDEIYDQVVYEGSHTSTASLAPDLVCFTYNGISKAYLLAGYRGGWLVVTGPPAASAGLRTGLDTLAAMRLGSNAPAQCAIAAALSGPHGPEALVLPGGRLRDQRDAVVEAIAAIPGVSCVPPAAALYAFPRIELAGPGADAPDADERMLLELLHNHHVLLSPGTAFNWPRPDHVRIVTLAEADDLRWAVQRLGEQLAAGADETRLAQSRS